MNFYPLKFNPIFKQKIWGGHKINTIIGKDFSPLSNCGESWELSSVEGNVSVVSNGHFRGEPLDGLIKKYSEEIMGAALKDQKFPLLFKFLDANDDLSIQVHPNDTLAIEKHGGLGKTEMWYILDADPGSKMYVGLNKEISKGEFIEVAGRREVLDYVCTEEVSVGDVFYVPAGRIHSIGKGILLAEIQQTSDITYRIYDFERTGDDGKPRDLHISDAADALNFTDVGNSFKTQYDNSKNYVRLVDSKYFQTWKIQGQNELKIVLGSESSFRTYMVTSGNGVLSWADSKQGISKGDVILVPAILGEYSLSTDKDFSGLEVFIA